MTRKQRSEIGSMTFEMVLMTPVLFAMMMFAIHVGQLAVWNLRVDRAAHEAARAASFELEPGDAERTARSTIAAVLPNSKTITCNQVDVAARNVGYADPDAVDAGLLTVRVNCTLSFPYFKLESRVSGVAVETIDIYRSRLGDPNG